MLYFSSKTLIIQTSDSLRTFVHQKDDLVVRPGLVQHGPDWRGEEPKLPALLGLPRAAPQADAQQVGVALRSLVHQLAVVGEEGGVVLPVRLAHPHTTRLALRGDLLVRVPAVLKVHNPEPRRHELDVVKPQVQPHVLHLVQYGAEGLYVEGKLLRVEGEFIVPVGHQAVEYLHLAPVHAVLQLEVLGDEAGAGGGEAAVQVGHDAARVGRTERRLTGRAESLTAVACMVPPGPLAPGEQEDQPDLTRD